MVDPGQLAEPTDIFVCGNDEAAKAEVTRLLAEFGWERERIRDLGDISAARGPEMYLPLWLRLMGRHRRPDVQRPHRRHLTLKRGQTPTRHRV